jgi:hypothetical protein
VGVCADNSGVNILAVGQSGNFAKVAMPRGSQPGERRGGRQRGTPNKKTLLKGAAINAASANPNLTPLGFLLALMRNPDLLLAERLRLAARVEARATQPWRHAHRRIAELKAKSELSAEEKREIEDLQAQSIRHKITLGEAVALRRQDSGRIAEVGG